MTDSPDSKSPALPALGIWTKGAPAFPGSVQGADPSRTGWWGSAFGFELIVTPEIAPPVAWRWAVACAGHGPWSASAGTAVDSAEAKVCAVAVAELNASRNRKAGHLTAVGPS